jgi:hypothetical protein
MLSLSRKKLSRIITDLAPSLFEAQLAGLRGRDVCIAVDSGSVQGTNYVIALLVLPQKKTSPLIISVDTHTKNRAEYTTFLASTIASLYAEGITVASIVTDGLLQQVQAIRPGASKRRELEDQHYKKALTMTPDLLYVTFNEDASAESLPSTICEVIPRPWNLHAIHVPCLCHLVNCAFKWAVKASPLRTLIGDVHARAVQLHKTPAGTGRCPLISPTRWMHVVRIIDWQLRHDPSIADDCRKLLTGVLAMLEPVCGLISCCEGDSCKLTSVFPLLVQLFWYLDLLRPLPLFQITELKESLNALESALWKITLGCDNGALYALAYALTPSGTQALQKGNLAVPLPLDPFTEPPFPQLAHYCKDVSKILARLHMTGDEEQDDDDDASDGETELLEREGVSHQTFEEIYSNVEDQFHMRVSNDIGKRVKEILEEQERSIQEKERDGEEGVEVGADIEEEMSGPSPPSPFIEQCHQAPWNLICQVMLSSIMEEYSQHTDVLSMNGLEMGRPFFFSLLNRSDNKPEAVGTETENHEEEPLLGKEEVSNVEQQVEVER